MSKKVEHEKMYKEVIAIIESRERSVKSQSDEQDSFIQGYLTALTDLRCFYIEEIRNLHESAA